jgi:hypothetical protein
VTEDISKVNRADHERKHVLLRIDPTVHDALTRWAADEVRSLNARVETLLRQALDEDDQMPRQAWPLPRRGRPPRSGND